MPQHDFGFIVRMARSLATILRKAQSALSETNDPYLKGALSIEIGKPDNLLNFWLNRDVESGFPLSGVDLTQRIYTMYRGRNALRSAMLRLVTLFYEVFHVRVQDVTRNRSKFSEDELKALEAAADELERAARAEGMIDDGSKTDDGGPNDSSIAAPASPPSTLRAPTSEQSGGHVEVRTAGDLWKAISEGVKPFVSVSQISFGPRNAPVNIIEPKYPFGDDQTRQDTLDRAVALVKTEGGDRAEAMDKLLAKVAVLLRITQAAAINMPIADFVAALTDGQVDPPKPTHGEPERKPTVNERMITKMATDLETVKGWTAQKWADHLGCAKSTVIEAETWKSLSLLRQQAKAEKRKDRRGTKPI